MSNYSPRLEPSFQSSFHTPAVIPLCNREDSQSEWGDTQAVGLTRPTLGSTWTYTNPGLKHISQGRSSWEGILPTPLGPPTQAS